MKEHQIKTSELLNPLHQQDSKEKRMTIKNDIDMLIHAGLDSVVNRNLAIDCIMKVENLRSRN